MKTDRRITKMLATIATVAHTGLASVPALAQVTFTQVTNDADCGIDSADTYTHAIDFGTGANALVNGVQFVSDFGTAAGSIPNSGSRTYGPSNHGGNTPPAVTGDVSSVFRDMRYNGPNDGYVELTGLTPGQPYEFRLYDRAWDHNGAIRPATLRFDIDADGSVEDTSPTYDTNRPQDAPVSLGGNVSWVTSYSYTAGSSGSLRVSIGIGGTGTYHIYGLSNVEAGPDVTPPSIESLAPADDATGVYPGTGLVATFSEDIALTGGGTITLTDITNATDNRTVTMPDTGVTVSGTDLIIDLTAIATPGNLTYATEYEVTIDGSVLQDLAAAPNSFGGTTSGQWTFTTASSDGTAPVLAAADPLSPANGASGVLLNTPLTVTFDEDILVNPGASSTLFSEDFEAGGGTDGGFAPVGTPNDWARGTPNSDNSDGLTITTGNGGSANCWATNLGTGGTPSGVIDPSADSILRGPGDGLTASSGIDLTGVASAQLQFAAAIDSTGGDTVEVLVKEVGSGTTLVTVPATALTPPVTQGWATHGPYDISDAAGSEVYLEFRYAGTSDLYIGLYVDDIEVTGVSTGNAITLKDLTNMTDTIIPISDSSQVAVSGATLTVTPSSTLAPMASYAIQIGSTAIRNYSDLDFAGIADTVTWTFATTGPMLLTWDPSGGGTSDGDGTWLDPGKWWDGSANVDWGNSTPDNAVIGNGGGGGTITMGTVNAGTVLIDKFTGSYTLNGGSLDIDTGITVGAASGDNVTFNTDISGTGGLVVNSPNRTRLGNGNSHTFDGGTTLTGGELLDYQFNSLGAGNLNINGGVLVGYWGETMNRALGTGAGEVQIPGGRSGFSGQGSNGSAVRFGNNDGLVTWGSSEFNPSTLVLQSPWANRNGKLTWRNQLDLNGSTRTIDVDKDHQNLNGGNFYEDGYAQIVSTISNGDAGNAAGLIKEGPGRLVFTATNTFDGGTTVNEGIVEYARADAMPDTGTHAFNDGTELWVRLGGGSQFTADPSGPGSLGGLLTGTGPGTSSTAFSGTVDLVLRPSGSPDYSGPLSMSGATMGNLWIFDGSMTLSGTGTYTGETIIGRRGGSAITVTLGSANALPAGTPVTVDTSGTSTLDLNGNNATIGLLTLGSNNGGQGGTVDDTLGGGVLTITDGITVDSHNDGGGRILCDTLDLNGATQTLRHLGNNRANSDFIIEAAIQNGGVITNATNGQTEIYFNGINTYTGGTTHQAGRLVLNGSLADATMDVQGGNVQGTGTLTFNISGTIIDQVVTSGGSIDISGMTCTVLGTPTETEYILVDATGGGSYSGTFADANLPAGYMLDYGTANIVKIVGTPSGDPPYTTWAGSFAGLTDTSAVLDFDQGGLPTGVEYVVGGDPTDPADDAGLAPTIDNTDPDFVIFSFNRTDLANGDANTTITVEYGNDLNGWTTAVDDQTDVFINETDNGATDTVEVSLRRSALQVDGELYIRLKVVVAAP